MNYAIKYWKEKETNPIEFLNHFRCTTEPIGGGTEHDDDGELVDYDAAVTAIAIAKKDIINKACEWLSDIDFDMETIRTSKEILKEWFEKNMSTHTDWTGTRIETKYECNSIDSFVDNLYEYLENNHYRC